MFQHTSSYIQFHKNDDDTRAEVNFNKQKLLRSADGRVVLQVEASLDFETKIAWYIILSRAQTCARKPVNTDGEKKCVQFAEAFALIFNILDK